MVTARACGVRVCHIRRKATNHVEARQFRPRSGVPGYQQKPACVCCGLGQDHGRLHPHGLRPRRSRIGFAREGDMADEPRKTRVKGQLIEDLVKRLHEHTDLLVRARVRMPTKANPKHYREIDVLATREMLGRTMHLAFECKNYGKRIGVPKVDEFRGKLEAVGIPVQHGIMIASANGYTADALERASELGITLLVLDGLSDDRLATVVYDAFQSIVYVLLSIAGITLTNSAPTVSMDEMLSLRAPWGELRGTVMDLVWAEWRDGRIPMTLGSHTLSVRVPADWHWYVGGQEMPTRAEVIVATTAYVLTLPGRATEVSLRDAQTGRLDRAQIAVEFGEDVSGTYQLSRASTEAELQALLRARGKVHITLHRVPLPRIAQYCWWPPSGRALVRLDRHYRDLMRAGKYDLWNHQPTFRELEGSDLAAVWDPIWPEHPASRDEDWPWTARRSARPQHRVTANPRQRSGR